jgi:hypothetical protein
MTNFLHSSSDVIPAQAGIQRGDKGRYEFWLEFTLQGELFWVNPVQRYGARMTALQYYINILCFQVIALGN